MENETGIRAIVKEDLELRNFMESRGSEKYVVTIKPGTYQLNRVLNPFGHNGNWLVIQGTTIGGAEEYWRSEGEFIGLTLEESTEPTPPQAE